MRKKMNKMKNKRRQGFVSKIDHGMKKQYGVIGFVILLGLITLSLVQNYNDIVGRSFNVPDWAIDGRSIFVVSPFNVLKNQGQNNVTARISGYDYIYTTGYIYMIDHWQEFKFNGTIVEDFWVASNATKIFDVSDFNAGEYPIIAYACNKIGAEFECNDNKWVISYFNLSNVPDLYVNEITDVMLGAETGVVKAVIGNSEDVQVDDALVKVSLNGDKVYEYITDIDPESSKELTMNIDTSQYLLQGDNLILVEIYKEGLDELDYNNNELQKWVYYEGEEPPEPEPETECDVMDKIYEGERKVYTIEEDYYEVVALQIDPEGMNPAVAKLSVNGQVISSHEKESSFAEGLNVTTYTLEAYPEVKPVQYCKTNEATCSVSMDRSAVKMTLRNNFSDNMTNVILYPGNKNCTPTVPITIKKGESGTIMLFCRDMADKVETDFLIAYYDNESYMHRLTGELKIEGAREKLKDSVKICLKKINGCVTLGGRGPNPSLGPNDPNMYKVCCDGLVNRAPKNSYIIVREDPLLMGEAVGAGTVCIACGNNNCESLYENKWNCPEDCEVNCAGEGEYVYNILDNGPTRCCAGLVVGPLPGDAHVPELKGVCEKEEGCVDSDGGKNYYSRGRTTGYEGEQLGSFIDSCGFDGVTLSEMYCDGSDVKVEQHTCPNGCQDGVCISAIGRSCSVDATECNLEWDAPECGIVVSSINGHNELCKILSPRGGSAGFSFGDEGCDNTALCQGDCEDGACVDSDSASCGAEGEEISTMPLPSGGQMSCCAGLEMIGVTDEQGGMLTDVAYCTRCGDGECKEPENEYNCPDDCSDEECVGEGEVISFMPLPSNLTEDAQGCCPGLSVVLMEGMVDAGYCTKCGDGICRYPETEYGCPVDCE